VRRVVAFGVLAVLVGLAAAVAGRGDPWAIRRID
jgi:hypothetical protein